jgi:hypothetical protein
MKQKTYKTYQEFEAQHKKMYPSHTTDQIKAAYKKYSEYWEMREAYGESWVVYNKDTKAKIPKSFKNRKAAYEYAAKNGGVVYSGEYYFDNQDDINSGKLVKEESLDEAVQKIDVEELLDAAAKMRKEMPALRKGQSIMITLHNMNPKLYSMAVDKADAFTVDAKIPDLINFLDPKYYAESANLDEATGTHSMGTVTITAPGNILHGKTANIFHKFPDGRINVQHRKSDKKGDVINLTLKKGEYKLDEAVDLETARKIKIVALATGSCDLEHIHEFVSLNPNMESIVTLKETYNKYIQSL